MKSAVKESAPNRSDFDIIVIGAGITGAWLARELSRYEGAFAVFDKEPLPGFGVTKGGLSQIHAPDFTPPGTLKAQFCVNAAAAFKQTARLLDLPFREVDELWLALEPSQIDDLKAGKARGEALDNRKFELIGPARIRELEPCVTSKALAALYVRGLGAVHPPEWAFALIENARQNHVRTYFNTAVVAIEKRPDGGYAIDTTRGHFSTNYIVNAAGLFADDIARMAGDQGIELILTKGTMAIMDKSVSHLTRHMVYGTFSAEHSQVVAPTVHGNLIVGLGTFTRPAAKNDTSVSRGKFAEVIAMGRQLIPALSSKDVITTFAGIKSENNRAAKGDFTIAPSEASPGIIHALISSPGLTGAPAVAARIIDLLADSGFELREKKTFNPYRASWPRFTALSAAERRRTIRKDPDFAHIVCRCENVSAAEIKAAIRRGADTMDGVKHLTRAGMGRCQGGFCGPSVFNLLSAETGMPPAAITKKGAGSHMILTRPGAIGCTLKVDKK